jgi:VanZ family protein
VSAETLAGSLLRVGFWLPLAICTYLAFAPSPPDAIAHMSDIVLHGFAFAYLTFALGLAYRSQRWWQTAAWMIAYGLAVEFVQSFEPQRSAELKDLGVDCVGVALGLGALALAGDRARTAAVRVTRVLARQA